MNNMNSNIFPVATFLGAAAALFVLPFSPAAAGFFITVPGILSLLILDYGRSFEPLWLRAGIQPFGPADRHSVEMRKAA
jgi:hypothetical protein